MKILPLIVVASALASSPPSSQVLAPTAERAVKALLELDTPIGESLRVDATIAKDRVFVTVGNAKNPTSATVTLAKDDATDGEGATLRVPEGTELALTLLHVDKARSGDTILGELALRPEPGPAPKLLVAEITKRIRVGGAKLPWVRVTQNESPEAPKEAKPPGADVKAITEQLSAARHRIATGEKDLAKTFLQSVPKVLSGPATVEVAALWRQLGDKERAAALLGALGELPPFLTAAKALILSDALPKDLSEVAKERRCSYAQLAGLALDLGHADKAEALLKVIQAEVPECVEAYDEHLQLLKRTKRAKEAETLAKDALERFGEDARILSSVASVYIAAGRYEAAIPLLDKSVRKDLKRPNPLRVLLGAVVRDAKVREAQTQALKARLSAEPKDVVTRFLVGVLHHYSHEFSESNALLQPLEAELNHADRLHIYLALNDLNLGQREAATERLKRLSMRADPDPDVYYYLAEVERDTERKSAKENLARYAAISHTNPLSNPDKEARVSALLTLLDQCLTDGRVACEGAWEHPRLRHEARQREKDQQRDTLVLVILGLALLAIAVVRRRRRAN